MACSIQARLDEHGIFSASSAGTLWDRTKFSAINLVGANGDGIQSTYDMTASGAGFSAGGSHKGPWGR